MKFLYCTAQNRKGIYEYIPRNIDNLFCTVFIKISTSVWNRSVCNGSLPVPYSGVNIGWDRVETEPFQIARNNLKTFETATNRRSLGLRRFQTIEIVRIGSIFWFPCLGIHLAWWYYESGLLFRWRRTNPASILGWLPSTWDIWVVLWSTRKKHEIRDFMWNEDNMYILMHWILSRSSYLWPCILTTFHEIILFFAWSGESFVVFFLFFFMNCGCIFSYISLRVAMKPQKSFTRNSKHLKKSMLT